VHFLLGELSIAGRAIHECAPRRTIKPNEKHPYADVLMQGDRTVAEVIRLFVARHSYGAFVDGLLLGSDGLFSNSPQI